MKLWLTLSFALFLSGAHARGIDMAEEEVGGAPSPSRFEGPGGIRHTKSSDAEGSVVSAQDNDEKTSSIIVGGDAFSGSSEGNAASVRDDDVKASSILLGGEALPKSEPSLVSAKDEDEKTSSTLRGGDASTTPGANTPGGGIPCIGDGFLNPPLPVVLPWWKRWWNSVLELFS